MICSRFSFLKESFKNDAVLTPHEESAGQWGRQAPVDQPSEINVSGCDKSFDVLFHQVFL